MANPKRTINDPSDTREGLLFLARLAGANNRFEHMFQYTKRLVEIVAPTMALTDFERRCFCSACTFLLHGQLKSYQRVAKSMTDLAGVDQWRADVTINYLQLIASDICNTCLDVVGIIDLYFLPPGYSPTAESRVFYNKMKGDILKYLMEMKKGVERNIILMDAFRAYMSAMNDEAVLPATHPTRLDLKLSLALFYAETRALHSVAYCIASEAVDMATREMEATGKIATEETALILGCLRSGMEIWRK